ncbi:TPA: 4-hydroxy-3-methylbut-2-enyl diphosphate reductase [Candidatus Scatousia excrementigallinarum]|uniref:4-hydroxy-3-methylbut-2-enyl diphosphate reductase n=1 Tax=Candidatus Scatousia excrementigallinarum TaxID=2840935 RepID=A0A9D1EWT0_9BACT|nr:4-hydroxy-3-methylbut-2-enyl diphosphate reductase [Candidatus Scatousia excrementigallinarum]
MPKQITLAKFAGFCYGVKRAVETVKKLKAENPDKNVSVLGELIHNTDVIKELEELGIKTLKEIPEKGDGICVVRSHGESPEVIDKIKKAGFTPVDLTCPDVKKVQQKAVELAKDDYYVVIVGKSEHPEVIAIKANAKLWSEKVIVAASVEQLKPFETEIKSHKRTGVVVQTTQRLSTLNEIVEYLTSISKELHIANTICQSTAMRQSEAKELAKENDLVIVVGSKKSANTTHLAEILKDITRTIHIENDTELDNYKDLIQKAQKIGITAGASTPQQIIEKVIKKIDKGE